MIRPILDRILDDVGRAKKPRSTGLTIALDTGSFGVTTIDDIASVSGAYWDMAKIGWGSSLITGQLEEKISCYRRHSITPLLGGTLFEYAYLRGRVKDLLDFTRELKIHIEVSDGVASVPRKERLHWIEQFSKHVEVFSEVGGKTEQQQLDWKEAIREDMSAGAKKVVIEGRELGPVGKPFRDDLLDELLSAADPSNLVFEALERKQQVLLIKKIGPNVSLGNIAPTDILTLESFRQGLKEHTLLSTYERQHKRERS